MSTPALHAVSGTLTESHAPCPLSAIGSPTLTWIAEEPKADGWWWAERISGDRRVLRVFKERGRIEGSFWVDLGDRIFWPASSAMFCGWRWAGPLPDPLEPSPVESSDKQHNQPNHSSNMKLETVLEKVRNVRNLATKDGESAAQLLARVKEMLAL